VVECREYGRSSTSFLVLLFAAGLLVGGLVTFYINFQEINKLSDDVAVLEGQISVFTGGSQNATFQNITVYQDSAALASIYSGVRNSVVLVQGTVGDSGIQGSAFFYIFSNRMIVITNNHVVSGTDGLSVTFSNGHGYAATVLGTDAYADLAVVSVSDAPASEFKPVESVCSSPLRVGERV